MTLKLTYADTGEIGHVKLAGRITSHEAADLLSARPWGQSRWIMDLSDLLSIDEAGLEALLQLRKLGIQLVGAKPYIAMLLDQTTKA